AASFGAGDSSLGGLPNGDLGGVPTAAAAASPASRSKPAPTPSGPPIPVAALGASSGRWMLLGLAVLALFCFVAGPLTLLLARPWPPHPMRALRRVLRFRAAGALPP
ncbi:MAG: hypothetical protein ACREQ5_32230, partial [Candidatus Dormibacteria bacterium]